MRHRGGAPSGIAPVRERCLRLLRRPANPLHKHAGIVGERLQPLHSDPCKRRMGGIDQAVVFVGSDDGRHEQQAALALHDKLITKSGEFGRGSSIPPVDGQLAGFHSLRAHILGNLRCRQYQISWWVVLIEVDEVLQHGQRLMFRGVAEAYAGTGPPSAVTICAFAVERIRGISLAQDAIDSAQLMPPYAMRPRMFSTCRAPSSVSIASTGATPPKARLGRFSQRRARSRSPRYLLAIATM